MWMRFSFASAYSAWTAYSRIRMTIPSCSCSAAAKKGFYTFVKNSFVAAHLQRRLYNGSNSPLGNRVWSILLCLMRSSEELKVLKIPTLSASSLASSLGWQQQWQKWLPSPPRSITLSTPLPTTWQKQEQKKQLQDRAGCCDRPSWNAGIADKERKQKRKQLDDLRCWQKLVRKRQREGKFRKLGWQNVFLGSAAGPKVRLGK